MASPAPFSGKYLFRLPGYPHSLLFLWVLSRVVLVTKPRFPKGEITIVWRIIFLPSCNEILTGALQRKSSNPQPRTTIRYQGDVFNSSGWCILSG